MKIWKSTGEKHVVCHDCNKIFKTEIDIGRYRNGTAEGTVRHPSFGRPATGHPAGAAGHVRSIWHCRSCHTASKIGVVLRSVWWRPVLAVVLPRWPYPADPFTSSPRLRSSLSGPAYRREASSDLCCSFSIQQIFLWSLPTLVWMFIATPMTVNSTSRRRLVQRNPQSSWWRPVSTNWIGGCHQTASSSTQTRLNSSGWGSRQQLLKVNPDSILLGASTVRFQSSVVDLGVVLDCNLSRRDHVSRLCRTSYYQLRQLRVIRRSLTTRACTQLVHALVNIRLDYCNSLLSGITDQLLSQLQSVLRASARLVLQRRKFDPYLQRHPGEASLATYPTENHLQTLSPRLQVPSWRGPLIPLRDVDTTVGSSPSSSTPFGRAW